MTKPSQTPDLTAHLVVCSHCAAVVCCIHRWFLIPLVVTSNVSSVHLKVHSVHRTHGVTRVASLIVRTCRLETNCHASRSATRVDSNEGFVLCKAILTSSPVQIVRL